MKLIKGKKIADNILNQIKTNIKQGKTMPKLMVVLVGNNEESRLYVDLKEKAAKKIGMNFEKLLFSEDVNEIKILDKIAELNQDKTVTGIIVQLPLPEKFNTQKIIEKIDYRKDADGFHQKNTELFFTNKSCLPPVFPRAILEMINSEKENLSSKKAIIVTKSNRFGKTMQETLRKGRIESKYVLCKKIKKNKSEQLKNADIIVTACGTPNLINAKMTKNNAVIIDGGIKKIDGTIYGDIDMGSFLDTDCKISPVPGGVGPVTVACLLRNAL